MTECRVGMRRERTRIQKSREKETNRLSLCSTKYFWVKKNLDVAVLQRNVLADMNISSTKEILLNITIQIGRMV